MEAIKTFWDWKICLVYIFLNIWAYKLYAYKKKSVSLSCHFVKLYHEK